MYKTTIILLLFGIFANCSDQNPNQKKWSVKMANAVMQRYDSLANYNGRTIAGWSYDVALLGTAINKLGSIDPKCSAYMQTYMDMLVDNTGHIARYNMESYNLDMIRPAVNLLTLHNPTGEKKYLDALPQFITQLGNQPRTKSGGFWHKKIYPWQMWLDGIYTAEPFLAQYAKEFNKPEFFDEVAHQIMLIYEKTRDPKTGLLYHAWDESHKQKWSNPETGCSPNFWSRAMGWYVMALVDVLDYFPKNHPQRKQIIDILKNTCEALVKVRDQRSGVWYQVLDKGGKTGNYLEASGSAMYVYAFAKGAKKGYLDKSFLNLANEAFDDLIKNFIITDKDGLISMTSICGSCGLGGNPYRDGSYDYYSHEKIVKNDSKGVAPFILAAFELNR